MAGGTTGWDKLDTQLHVASTAPDQLLATALMAVTLCLHGSEDCPHATDRLMEIVSTEAAWAQPDVAAAAAAAVHAAVLATRTRPQERTVTSIRTLMMAAVSKWPQCEDVETQACLAMAACMATWGTLPNAPTLVMFTSALSRPQPSLRMIGDIVHGLAHVAIAMDSVSGGLVLRLVNTVADTHPMWTAVQTSAMSVWKVATSRLWGPVGDMATRAATAMCNHKEVATVQILGCWVLHGQVAHVQTVVNAAEGTLAHNGAVVESALRAACTMAASATTLKRPMGMQLMDMALHGMCNHGWNEPVQELGCKVLAEVAAAWPRHTHNLFPQMGAVIQAMGTFGHNCALATAGIAVFHHWLHSTVAKSPSILAQAMDQVDGALAAFSATGLATMETRAGDAVAAMTTAVLVLPSPATVAHAVRTVQSLEAVNPNLAASVCTLAWAVFLCGVAMDQDTHSTLMAKVARTMEEQNLWPNVATTGCQALLAGIQCAPNISLTASAWIPAKTAFVLHSEDAHVCQAAAAVLTALQNAALLTHVGAMSAFKLGYGALGIHATSGGVVQGCCDLMRAILEGDSRAEAAQFMVEADGLRSLSTALAPHHTDPDVCTSILAVAGVATIALPSVAGLVASTMGLYLIRLLQSEDSSRATAVGLLTLITETSMKCCVGLVEMGVAAWLLPGDVATTYRLGCFRAASVTVVGTHDHGDRECAVCLAPLAGGHEDGKSTALLRCGHSFHLPCTIQLMEHAGRNGATATCPMCRVPV